MKYALLTISILTLTLMAEQSEEQLLTSNRNAYRPDSTTLCLITSMGDTLMLRDSSLKTPPMEEEFFDLIDYFSEQNIWVVEIRGFEWVGWELINGYTGSIQRVIAAPILSPDGNRLLCMMEDIHAGYVTNGIQIWRLDNNSLILEFVEIHVLWGPINGEWRGNHRIVFDKLNYDFSTELGMLYIDGKGNWVLYDAFGGGLGQEQALFN